MKSLIKKNACKCNQTQKKVAQCCAKVSNRAAGCHD